MTAKMKNHYAFGLGTIGRDMLYSMVSMYLIFYFTDIVGLPTSTLWWVTAIVFGARFFDAINDPFMGWIVDNTKSRFGKFKPWIAIGGFTSGILTILMFTDFNLTGTAFIITFGFIYILWGIAYTANDIAYWSMMPALSLDQKEREKIGAFARICANIGLFTVVAGIVPITNAIGTAVGSMEKGYLIFTVIVVAILYAGLSITLFGVEEELVTHEGIGATKLRDMAKVIFANDQLLIIAIAMGLFMIGYITTTSFGLYFFKYAFKNESMYSIFALVLGVSQLSALIVFPLFSRKFDRSTLFNGAMVFIILGYLIFFFSPMNMIFIGLSGILMFLGQAFIQLLMLMSLADTVEYGQWKLGKRNESITFSMQPFINKMGGAIASGIVSITVILSGIAGASEVNDVTKEGLMMMKSAMLVFPLILVIISYLIYRIHYKIDSELYEKIVRELIDKGELS